MVSNVLRFIIAFDAAIVGIRNVEDADEGTCSTETDGTDDRIQAIFPEVDEFRSEQEVVGRRIAKEKRSKQRNADPSEPLGYDNDGYQSIDTAIGDALSDDTSKRKAKNKRKRSTEYDDGVRNTASKIAASKSGNFSEVAGQSADIANTSTGDTSAEEPIANSVETVNEDNRPQSMATEPDGTAENDNTRSDETVDGKHSRDAENDENSTDFFDENADIMKFFRILKDDPEVLSAALNVLAVRGGALDIRSTLGRVLSFLRDKRFKDKLFLMSQLGGPDKDAAIEFEKIYAAVICALAIFGDVVRYSVAPLLYKLYGPAINFLLRKFHDDANFSCSDLQMEPEDDVNDKAQEGDNNFDFWETLADTKFKELVRSPSKMADLYTKLKAEVAKVYRMLRKEVSPKTICEQEGVEEAIKITIDTARPILTKWCSCSERQTCTGARCSFGLGSLNLAHAVVATECEIAQESSTADGICHDENVLDVVNTFSGENATEVKRFWKRLCRQEFQLVSLVVNSTCKLWGDSFPFKEVEKSTERVGNDEGSGYMEKMRQMKFSAPKMPSFSAPKMPSFSAPKMPDFSSITMSTDSAPKMPDFSSMMKMPNLESLCAK
eukprot:TRINITY_DN5332_c0_g1_i1.p1 TRINITY_DN5332_c0_g1~~TRINITY_DN5332_c0_g1_i1.p1  ORF type:complete len:608 (+),score=75.00 TRINITY_DN5332_c0_g1_i1:63-1886(+)